VHCLSALRTLDCDFIDILFVHVFRIDTAQVFEFLTASYADFFSAVIASPDWNRVAPVAVAADCPVAASRKPFAEASFLYVRRLPVNLGVCAQQSVVLVGDFYKPAAYSAVDERRIAPPAVRIRVQNLVFLYELALFLESLHDVLVTVFYKASFVVGNFVGELAFSVNRF